MKNKYSASDRKSGDFRVWDWLVIILAMLLFFVAAGYYFYTKYLPDAQEKITCTLLIRGEERAAWEGEGEKIFVGDSLRCQNGTVEMGRIEAVEKKPHLYAAIGEEGASWEEHPYLIDVEVLVSMYVRSKDGDGLRVGDLRVAAGSTGEFRFGRYLARAEIVEVRRAG